MSVPTLYQRYKFFRNYGHQTTTSAYGLARAETWAREVGAAYEWEDDWEIPDHVAEFDCYIENPATCEQVILRIDGEVRGSLGCIDDADDDYRRFVDAELALEAMTGPTVTEKGATC